MPWNYRGGCRTTTSFGRVRVKGLVSAALVAVAGTSLLSGQVPTYTIFVPPAATRLTPAQPDKHAVNRKVSLDVRDRTIEYAVERIARQLGMRVAYDSSRGALARHVTVQFDGVGMDQALSTVLNGSGLGYRIAQDGETIVVGVREGQVSGPRTLVASGVLAGRVTDSASGKGIGGATVVIRGTLLKTTTAESGQFVLREVPVGDQVLSVRAFGYKATIEKVTVTDSERTVVQIVLRPAPTVLSGVVTTATGVQERRQLGNDITVLNADSIQQIAPVATLTDLLETRVPGLTVLRESGIPGAPRRVRLLGTSSIERSNDPILIVDGVRVNADQSGKQTTVGGGPLTNTSSGQFYGPSPLNQIDPNSIETIEVFKGPSASAMYGADAANGVIVVTTKRGRAGKTSWHLSLDDGRTSLPSGGYPLNTFRFGQATNSHFQNQSVLCPDTPTPEQCATDSLVRYQALNDPRFNVFGQGQRRQASLSVNGGSGQLTYALTGSGSKETGLFQLPVFEVNRFQLLHGFPAPGWMRHPDQLSTWGGTSRLDLPLAPGGASVAVTSSYFSSQQQQSSLQGAVAALLSKYIDTTDLSAPTPLVTGYTLAQLGSATERFEATLHWPVRSWLPVDVTGGLDGGSTDSRSVLPRGYVTDTQDSVGTFSAVLGHTDVRTLTAGTTLLAPAQGRLPGIRMPVGFNWVSNTAWSMAGSIGGLPPGVLDPTALGGGSQSNVTATTYGWYVAPTLDLNSRFFASPGLRFDGGSASGHSAGFSPFPKLDFSWLAINQPEQPVLGAITLLRPRVAFGIAGEQPDPTSQYRLLQTTTGSAADGVPSVATFLTSYGNTRLKPERSREVEGGADLTLGNQRLSLILTGYDKLLYDAIMTTPIAPSVGQVVQSTGTAGSPDLPGIQLTGGTYAYNVGTVRNTGVNATVEARLLDTRAVLWQVNTNISKNKNVLLTLAPGITPPDLSDPNLNTANILVPGYPLNGIWARPIAGYADLNQNGRIDTNEVRLGNRAVFLGTADPTYQLTASTNLSLFNGRLSINTAVDYQNGLTQAYSVAVNGNHYDPTSAAFSSALTDPATPLSRQAAIMAAFIGSPIGLMQTVNTLRWQSLSVNYQAPQSVARWFRVNRLTLALQGSNLGLHTNYRGKDPDIGFTPGSNAVVDNGQLPQPRLWQLHITLGN